VQGYTTAAGYDGNATLTITRLLAVHGEPNKGSDGLTFSDADGNSIKLTNSANTAATVNQTIGQVTVGAAQFQIGGTVGQTMDWIAEVVFPEGVVRYGWAQVHTL